MGDENLDLALIVVATLLVALISITVSQRFSGLIHIIFNAEINVFWSGLIIPFRWVLFGFIFLLMYPLVVAVLNRDSLWERLVFRHNHPMYGLKGFVYQIPLIEKPSEKLRDETEENK